MDVRRAGPPMPPPRPLRPSIASDSQALSSRISSASRKRSGAGPTPQAAIRASRTRPSTSTSWTGDAGKREIAVAATDLGKGRTRPVRNLRKFDRDQHLVRLQRRGLNVDEESRGGDPALAPGAIGKPWSPSSAAATAGSSAAGSAFAMLPWPPTVPRVRIGKWATYRVASCNSGTARATTVDISIARWRAVRADDETVAPCRRCRQAPLSG